MVAILLLLSFFHLLLIGVVFFSIKNKNHFNSILKAFLVLVYSHIFSIYFQIGSPISLLYGPMVFLLYRETYSIPIRSRIILWHFIPFLFFLIFYTVLYFGLQTQASWSESWLIYYPLYLASSVISLTGYWFGIQRSIRAEKVVSTYKDSLLNQLLTMNLVAGAFILVLVFKFMSILLMNIEIDLVLFLSLILFISSLLIIRYLIVRNKQVDNSLESMNTFKAGVFKQSDNLLMYKNVAIGKDTFLDYEVRIKKALGHNKIFLKPDLSLDMMVQATNIPKHHFSQLFSVHLKTNFYRLLADYRIAYAIKQLEEGRNVTLESLAYECGFNSKTSFNRYFKEITGKTPSEYRNLKID